MQQTKSFKKLKILENYKKILIEEFIPGREIRLQLLEKKIRCNWIKTQEKILRLSG